MYFKPSLIIKEFKLIHPWKTPSFNESILLGIVIDKRLSQYLKANSPISFTLLGNSIETILVQPVKAYFPILTTLSGIVTFLSLLHAWNELSPMEITDLGMITDVISVQKNA